MTPTQPINGAVLLVALAVLATLVAAYLDRRLRIAADKDAHPASRAQQRAAQPRIALHVWFQCRVCKRRCLVQDVDPDAATALLANPEPWCDDCSRDIALYEKELSA